MYGDGAANQGQLFESSNIAYLWKLPVIYFLENNMYAMGTSIERASNEVHLHRKLGNIPGLTVDGLNIFHVREVVRYFKKWCVANGPVNLNVMTYRYHGHSMSDPGVTYRTREEVQDYRKNKDCIEYVKKIALENSLLTEAEIEDIQTAAKELVDEETQKALKSKPVSLKYLTEDIYDPQFKCKLDFNIRFHQSSTFRGLSQC